VTAAPLHICGLLWAIWIVYWIASAAFTLKTKKNEGIARLQHTAPTAFALFAVFHEGRIPELSWGQLHDIAALAWFGVALTVSGLCFSAWARVHLGKYWSGTVALKEGHRLVDTGPYRLVRHPIYTGLLFAALGSALAAGTVEALAGVVVMVPAYIIKWRREERLMLGELGVAYADYMKRTKAIIPYVV
jgi:protein-S-isoprenylcysteine O-methyltransferase Ste14